MPEKNKNIQPNFPEDSICHEIEKSKSLRLQVMREKNITNDDRFQTVSCDFLGENHEGTWLPQGTVILGQSEAQYLSTKSFPKVPQNMNVFKQYAAVVVLQAWWRGILTRSTLLNRFQGSLTCKSQETQTLYNNSDSQFSMIHVGSNT